MYQYHGINQHNYSQSMHPPYPSYQPYPAFQHGLVMNSLPHAVNRGPIPAPIHRPTHQHFPPPEPPKKKRKKKPNERRIQKFRNKAARHQKALALGMALLERMDESTTYQKQHDEVNSTENNTNHSTTCLSGLKHNNKSSQNGGVSNKSFDINENIVGSITNINIETVNGKQW